MRRAEAVTARSDDATLDELQRRAFAYFLHETRRGNGLVADKTSAGSPASVAAVGLGLAADPIGVERGFLTRAEARRRALATLRFFRDAPQSRAADAATVRTPQPQNESSCMSVSATRAARAGSAIPAKRQCPAFDVRTRQGRLSPSSART